MQLQVGQRLPLSELSLGDSFAINVDCDLPETDITAFGLKDGILSDDRYMIFFNQPKSPEGAIEQLSSDRFKFNLAALPASITEIYLTVTHDTKPISEASRLEVTFENNSFNVKPHLVNEKAVMLIRLYRHSGTWRLATVAQGFDGGLAALVQHFGGKVAEEASASALVFAPVVSPVNLKKERQRVLLEKAEKTQPQLVNLIKTASVSLEKRGLGNTTYRVNLVLDISGSMHEEYNSGAIQALAERALALATRLDDDGLVEVYLFGIKAHRKGSLSLDNIARFIDTLDFKLEAGTHYSPVMTIVREDARATGFKIPTLVLFITDGGSSNRDAVVRQMIEASSEPIFWKFMGIEQGRVNFDFLEKLDDLSSRKVDNADFFKVPAPIHIPDAELFELLVNELDIWQIDATTQSIIHP